MMLAQAGAPAFEPPDGRRLVELLLISRWQGVETARVGDYSLGAGNVTGGRRRTPHPPCRFCAGILLRLSSFTLPVGRLNSEICDAG